MTPGIDDLELAEISEQARFAIEELRGLYVKAHRDVANTLRVIESNDLFEDMVMGARSQLAAAYQDAVVSIVQASGEAIVSLRQE